MSSKHAQYCAECDHFYGIHEQGCSGATPSGYDCGAAVLGGLTGMGWAIHDREADRRDAQAVARAEALFGRPGWVTPR